MLYTPETYQIEKKLVRWCKTGEPQNIPGTHRQGLNQYRRLIRNNFHNAMEQAFPIAHTVLTEPQWNRLVDDFLAKHPAATPQVWKLPEEFCTFVKNNHYAERFSLPFLSDLLLFEWVEIEVHTLTDRAPAPYKKEGDPFTDAVVVHPEHRLIRLTWPVHLYAAEKAREHPGDYYLLTFRTHDFDVRFVDLPALHAFFFEQFSSGQTLTDILETIKAATPQMVHLEELTKNIVGFMKTMFSEKIFPGYKK